MENRNRLHGVILWLITLLVLPFYIKSQEVGSAPHFKVTADLVSSYLWRGSLSTSTPMPNIQTTQAFTNGNFEIGVLGSTDFTGIYKEAETPGVIMFPG